MKPVPVTDRSAADAPEVLLAILTDLSTDHRCFKLATTLKGLGYRPVIYCDRPLHPPGPAWEAFDVRVIARVSHMRRFLPAFLEFLIRLMPALWKTRAKLWISLDAPPLFWVALWGRLRGRTVVYDSHELFSETPMVRSRPTRRLFWSAWERGGFALIRRAMTISPAVLDRLRARHPSVRFHLLPNMPIRSPRPVTLAEKPMFPQEGGAPVRLVYQGGLRAAAGLLELLEALRTRPRFTLEVYGGGPEEAALRATASAPELEGRVRFHGSVPFEALEDKMREAHLGLNLVQPVCESFALTWANKIFDYTHALCPVLLSDNPAHHLLLEEFQVGVIVDAFSPEAVGEGLDRLAANHAFHVEECRRAREAWHWDAYARDLPEFFEERQR
jgi:glycosyltransferase involved in cell wall biosynthesis